MTTIELEQLLRPDEELRKLRKKGKSERDYWRANCMATSPFDGRKEHMICPECKANGVRPGTGPIDKKAP